MKPDNKFFSFMSLVGDIILLNVLFVITSIPIVTAGISLTALYTSIKKGYADRSPMPQETILNTGWKMQKMA